VYNRNQASSSSDLVLPFYLSDLWRGFRTLWWAFLLLILLSTAVAMLCDALTVEYTASATATVLIENPFLPGRYEYAYNWATATQLADALTYVLSCERLERAICAQLNCPELPAVLSVFFTADTNLLTLHAAGPDPQASLAVLEAALELCPTVAEPILGSTQFVVLAEPALPETAQSALGAAALCGALLGSFLCAVWLVLYAILRKTIRTDVDVRQQLGLPCLGALPPLSHTTEYDRCIQQLREIVSHKLHSTQKVILISETASGEGASAAARSLAASFAEIGRRVLLIRGSSTVSEPSMTQITPYLDLLQIQGECSGGISGLQKDLLPLRAQYERIFIDAPPCEIGADGLYYAAAADAVCFVVKQDTVSEARIQACLDELSRINTLILGCILTETAVGFAAYGRK